MYINSIVNMMKESFVYQINKININIKTYYVTCSISYEFNFEDHNIIELSQ